MRYQSFGDTTVLRLEAGEEVVACLTALCKKEGIRLACVSGLGAVDHVVMGVFNVEERRYHSNEKNEEMELTALCGNVTEKEGEVYLHLHATFGDKEGHAWGGHLNEARVSATAEVFVRALPGVVGRVCDKRTGLNVLDMPRAAQRG